MIDFDSTVGNVAAERPEAARVFERLGIDYCCGGKRRLAEVCSEKGLDFTKVVEAIEQPPVQADPTRDWKAEPVPVLVDHLLSSHHVYTRDALQRLDALSEKVRRVHGNRHPELVDVRALFEMLRADLEAHLLKEENVLFPYIEQLASGSVLPASCFGTVQNPIRMMEHEHDTAGDILARLRKTTDNYTMPADGCASYSALYHGLEELEQDLHQHIHLENNVLFPRAIALETERAGGRA